MTSNPKPGLPRYATMPVGMKLDPSKWHSLPLGVNSNGEYTNLDLTGGGHTMVTGPCGSGKSVFLRQLASAALTRGHDLIIIEPVKRASDFMPLRPWCVAFGGDGIGEARAILEAAYAEGMRRKVLMKEHNVASWTDLPAEVRPKALTVIFDEYMVSVMDSPRRGDLDEDDPRSVEAERNEWDKLTIMALVTQIVLELRHCGISLVLSMQRPDASLLPGMLTIRANLAHTIQLVRPGLRHVPHRAVLRMTFSAEQTAAVAETIADLNADDERGLAVMADEQDVTGFRVLFEQQSKIPALLERRGVPRATPWVLSRLGRDSARDESGEC